MGDDQNENELDSLEEQADIAMDVDRDDGEEDEDDDSDALNQNDTRTLDAEVALDDTNDFTDNEPSRRASRPSRASKAKPKETKTPEKKGQKRKLTASTSETPAKSKIPKYEFVLVSLVTKTIYIKKTEAHKYKIDRAQLTTIPEKEGPYGVGDLIWAKMTGYPWWPCIISIDPESGKHSKISGSSCKADRVYHVQYFGPEAYRGWTNIGMVMPFEGFEKFYEQISEEIEHLPKPKIAKVLEKCHVKPGIKKKWNESIAEAELAMKLDIKERVRRLTFNYVHHNTELTKEASSKPRKSTASVSQPVLNNNSNADVTSSSAKSTKKGKSRKNSSAAANSSKNESISREDVYDFPEDSDGPDAELLPEPLAFRSRPIKGDFQVFLRKHFEEASKKHPNRSKAEIKEYLKEEWDGMTDKIRETYTERKAIALDDSAMLVAKRPSNFEDNYFNDSDDDYNDSEDGKSPDDGDDNSSNLIISQAPVKSNSPVKTKRSRSRKSEKLFDQIKNAADSNGTDVGPSTSASATTSSNKRRSASAVRSTSKKSEVTPTAKASSSRTAVSKPASTTVSATASRKSVVDSSKSETEKKEKPTGNIKKKLCFTDTSGDDTNSSDAASVNSEPIESKRKSPPADRFCFKCSNDEMPTELLVSCEGVCQRRYHKGCINYTGAAGERFFCEECTNDKHKCFACNNPDDLETKKCEDNKCGRFYHLSCIENNYPIRVNESANSFLCPLHTCLTCHHETLEDKEYRANNKKLIRCIWCPTAYHNEIFCISAGTVRVSRNFIICPEHCVSENTAKSRQDRHINVNYCFACLSGGNLICCESCPSAFHEECLEYSFDHDKSFYCSSCVQRKQLHYGDVVWVKLGSYRWWPGRICHPNIVPENVLNLNHNVGDFPVYFFGSHDYYWINKGRVYLYLEGDNQAAKASGNKSNNSKTLKATFAKGIEEAEEAFVLWTHSRKEMVKQTIANKPPPYQHINSNRYLVPQKTNGNGNSSGQSGVHICVCKDESHCQDENCLNRISLIECDPKLCPARDQCKNQRFRKSEYVKCKPFKTKSAGWGLMATEDIKEGQFVIEYCGEVIDEEECDRRLKKIASDQSNFYFLNLDKDLFIDAGPKGNLARFMNHSCEPNCITQKWVVNNATRVGLFALKDIASGTELTFNYNLDCRGNERTKCECGSVRCSGFIGERPRNDETQSKRNQVNGAKPKKSKNSKRKILFEQLHEDACFKCGERGKLLMCDFTNCPKAYHLKCLNLPARPKSKWSCPVHVCMKEDCKVSASIFCSVCPNSYCREHAASFMNDLQLPDEKFLCEDHRSSNLDEVESELAEAESEHNEIEESNEDDDEAKQA